MSTSSLRHRSPGGPPAHRLPSSAPGPCGECRARVEARADRPDLRVRLGGEAAPARERALEAHDPARLLSVAERILGSRDLAWDALQEAYVCLWQQAEAPPNVDAWLTHTVVHRSLHTRRTRQRRAQNEHSAGESRCQRVRSPDPTRSAEEQELRERVERAVQSLPVEFRAAFVLQANGLEYHEVAARLGVPVGTVRSRIHRARARLAELLAAEAPACARQA
jgi:RNA polymerase sigma-70 factor (ECF subfamily)